MTFVCRLADVGNDETGERRRRLLSALKNLLGCLPGANVALLVKELHRLAIFENPTSLGVRQIAKCWKKVVEEKSLDGERATGGLGNWGESSRGVLEVVLEQRWVDSSRHEDDVDGKLPLASVLDKSLDDDEKQIGVDVSFVNLVDKDVRQRVEPGRCFTILARKGMLKTLEEDTRRGKHDISVGRGELGLKSNLVTDRFSNAFSSLSRYSLGDRGGSEPPRLGTENVALGTIASSNVIV